MSEKQYLIRLGEHSRKRHYHKTDKGQVVAFRVQLEVEIEDGDWKPVIRYDCAHSFAHRDRYPVLEPPPQTPTLQDADLDFGHVEPTRMFGRRVKLDATQQRSRGLVTEHLLKAGAKMRVEVVKNQVNLPGPG